MKPVSTPAQEPILDAMVALADAINVDVFAGEDQRDFYARICKDLNLPFSHLDDKEALTGKVIKYLVGQI